MSGALTFGVYPFGLAGGPDGVAAGAPDDFGQIRRLLRILQGDGAELLVRTYVAWSGADTTDTALGQIADLVGTGLRWDLVLAYRDRQADIGAWTEFVSRVVIEFATYLAALQVTGEANLTGIPDAGDGAYPGAAEALVHGIFAAATAKRQRALNVPVGFAVVPEREPAAGTFWPAVAALGGSRFQTCVDYVGIDMYPDVFGGRIEQANLDPAVGEALRTLRHKRCHWPASRARPPSGSARTAGPPGQIAPNAGKQTYSTLCCAPFMPAATSSTSLTGSSSPSATPTARAPTPSTSSVSCATTTAPNRRSSDCARPSPSSDEAPGTCGKRDG